MVYIYAIFLSVLLPILVMFVKEDKGYQAIKEEGKKEKLCQKRASRSIFNAIVLGIATQITGICVVSIFATAVFQNVFKSLDSFMSSAIGAMIMSIFKITGCLPTYLVLNKWGRKTILMIGFAGTVVGNAVYAVSFSYPEGSNMRMILIICGTGIVVFLFEFGPGMITYIIYGEAFPIALKS